ncbi:MAG: hypothetical protein ABIP56_03915 [Dokdonella sp.]
MKRDLDANETAQRPNIARLVKDKLSDVFGERQRHDKVSNLLPRMRRDGRIVAERNTRATVWRLVP